MIIREARADDVDFFLERVAHEGWLSETRNSFETFMAHDPAGCFIAENDGVRAGMCVATAYERCGFLGELIVVPERRGHGLGTALMQRAIAYLKMRGCASIYLDGDPPAVPIYEGLGFRTVTRSLRFLGKLDGREADGIHPISPDELRDLTDHDRRTFGADRSFFLKRRVELFPRLCLVQSVGGRPGGYIMGQPGCGVVTVGPWLVINESIDPLDLLRALAWSCGGTDLRVGVLESNRKAAASMRSLTSFVETEACLRMVLGPDGGLGRSDALYAIGSPAKG